MMDAWIAAKTGVYTENKVGLHYGLHCICTIINN